MARPRHALLGRLAAFMLSSAASFCAADGVMNLTGLPVYPNLSKALMDDVFKTDALGHWCSRFSAETFSSLEAVEDWYRKVLAGASETDLAHDAAYRKYPRLVGIKLALNRDYVTVYRASNRASTSIELYACAAPT